MTKRKSRSVTSQGRDRPSRGRAAAASQRPEPINRLPGRDPPPATLEEAIEQERARMDKACSVLGCLRHALTHHEHFEGDPDRPSFAEVAELAHDLVADAIHRLDSLYIAHLPRARLPRRERDRSRRRGPSTA